MELVLIRADVTYLVSLKSYKNTNFVFLQDDYVLRKQ